MLRTPWSESRLCCLGLGNLPQHVHIDCAVGITAVFSKYHICCPWTHLHEPASVLPASRLMVSQARSRSASCVTLPTPPIMKAANNGTRNNSRCHWTKKQPFRPPTDRRASDGRRQGCATYREGGTKENAERIDWFKYMLEDARPGVFSCLHLFGIGVTAVLRRTRTAHLRR